MGTSRRRGVEASRHRGVEASRRRGILDAIADVVAPHKRRGVEVMHQGVEGQRRGSVEVLASRRRGRGSGVGVWTSIQVHGWEGGMM